MGTGMDSDIERMRNFNRFYTNLIGLLDGHVYESPFSLTEARILYEINTREAVTARRIMETIAIDEAYLSRIIQKFMDNSLIKKEQSANDKRMFFIRPTTKGKKAFEKINTASRDSLKGVLQRLSASDRSKLIHHFQAIQSILTKHS